MNHRINHILREYRGQSRVTNKAFEQYVLWAQHNDHRYLTIGVYSIWLASSCIEDAATIREDIQNEASYPINAYPIRKYHEP